MRVVVDAGHHEREVGAGYTFPDGLVLREDALNLRVALQLQQLLQAGGYQVTLTRSSAAPVNAEERDLNGDGAVSLADDLQSRVDLANRVGADLFVSVHFNGHPDLAHRGTYTFWNPQRPFADRSRALAERVQAGLVQALRRTGYDTPDHGARTDASVLGDDEAYLLLGPASDALPRPSRMPGVVGEALFLTNPRDAEALQNDRIVDAVARGYVDGIQAYAAPHPAPAAAASAPSGADEHSWTVWAVTYRETPTGAQLAAQAAEQLARGGLSAEVLVSRQHAALRPGFLVVSAGRFANKEAATARLPAVQALGYGDAYVREVT
jgi:N-acetylmuramoyl-L-alanine amidase